jgi:acetoin:2,6-dichlorophenolindophenol oxidoreductase subunit beta
MAKTVRDIIKSITRHHLEVEKSLCFGQCLTAVGWVGGTLPEMYEDEGMVEVTTADVANGGFVVGAGLQGIKPIYVVRYQGFQWFNSPIIVNYAAKSKEMWDMPCSIFIRSIAMEGGVGPVAGSSHHSIYQRMPGTKILSPMTPNEYQLVYNEFMVNDDVYYISEHRKSYDNTEELNDVILEDSDVVLFPISITRFEVEEARKRLMERGIRASIIHQLWIKPFTFKDEWKNCLNNSRYGGIVLDDDYEQGVASSIAHRMMIESDKKVYTLGLDHKTAGFYRLVDNLPPSSVDIVNLVERIVSYE